MEEDYESDDAEELTARVEELEKKLSDLEGDHNAEAGFYLFGSALAMVLSWSRNASILWCMGHGFLSWFYVIYFAFTRRG